MEKSNKLLFYLLFILLSPYNLFSQINPCLTNSFFPTGNISENKVPQIIFNTESSSTGTIKHIPAVFHIIHQGGPENISDAQVYSQLDVLNRDFRKLNADTANTDPAFAPIAADMEIEFCLALYDPQGNPTNGIDRHFSSISSSTQLINQFGWDNKKYMNIYVTPQTGCFSSFPWSPDSTDGIFIIHSRIGTMGTAGSQLYDAWARFGRTATHEAGHFLGLLHTFSYCDTSCFSGDSICDTPLEDMRWIIDTCLGHNSNSCIENPDLPDMVDNYMDYNVDSCLNLFTIGQKQRVHSLISYYRARLFSDSNLAATGCDTIQTFIPWQSAIQLALFPNPTTGIVSVISYAADIKWIRIYNSIGKLMKAETGIIKQGILNLEDFDSGVYYLHIMTGEGVIFKRIIINKI